MSADIQRKPMPHCPACHSDAEFDATECGVCKERFPQPAFGLLESRLTPSQERSLKVHPAVPVVLGLLGIGGAALGFFAVVMSLVTGNGLPGIGTIIASAIVAVLYAFSAWCGVLALQRRSGWLRKNFVLWAIQVPVLFSPVLVYSFFTGLSASVWVRVWPLGAGSNFFFGSQYSMAVFTSNPLLVGVNLWALGLAGYLWRLERRAATAAPL